MFSPKDLNAATVVSLFRCSHLRNTNTNVENFQVLVKQKKDQLFFCHKIQKGGANKSYGIEAAKLAGVPKEVTDKARLVLDYLEKNNQLNSQIKIK